MIAELTPTEELLKALGGITDRTLRGYFARGCPRGPIEAAVAWRDEHIGNNGPPTVGERAAGAKVKTPRAELDEEEQRARIEKLQQEARAKQLKNDVAEGELVYRDEVEQKVAELCLRIKHRIEAIPQELETEWPVDLRESIKERMTDKLHLILTEMSQWEMGTNE